MYKLPRRKCILFVSIAIVAILLLYAPATFAGNNRWTQLGPADTVVESLAIKPITPDTLYAGTQDGVLKTTNGGGDWTPVNTGLASLQVLTLSMHPTTPGTLYVVVASYGLYKTTNGGGDWAPINTGLTNKQIYAVVIHPAAPETLHAGTWGGGVLVAATAIFGTDRAETGSTEQGDTSSAEVSSTASYVSSTATQVSSTSQGGRVACPRGLVNDPYPGKCHHYVDATRNGFCDYFVLA